MSVAMTIPDEMARQVKPYEAELSEILELGLREWQARGESGYSGLNSLLEALAALPTPEEVLALRPSPGLQQRLNDLLDTNRTTGLSPNDRREWEQYQYVEHLVRMAKISATRKLQSPVP
jgi:hypothetical protein